VLSVRFPNLFPPTHELPKAIFRSKKKTTKTISEKNIKEGGGRRISHPPVIIFYLPIATIGGYFRFVVCLFIPIAVSGV
jgi:hypothetical protein